MAMNFIVSSDTRDSGMWSIKLQTNNASVVQYLYEFKSSIDMHRIFSNQESRIVTFNSFLEKIKNGEDGQYIWYNMEGLMGMGFTASTSTFISRLDALCMVPGTLITLDLSDEEVKTKVITELSKLVAAI